MFVTYYDRVFLVPAAQKVKRRLPAAREEFEFSEEMRDFRFLPGWYIAPSLGIFALIVTCVALI